MADPRWSRPLRWPDAALVHIIGRDDLAALGGATELRPPSLDAVGFVHLSDPRQVVVAAERHYAGRDDLRLLVIDTQLLEHQPRWEEGVPPEGDLRFPHLYGPLPLDAVVGVLEFPIGADGRFTPPDPEGRVTGGP